MSIVRSLCIYVTIARRIHIVGGDNTGILPATTEYCPRATPAGIPFFHLRIASAKTTKYTACSTWTTPREGEGDPLRQEQALHDVQCMQG
jgi:hypothetical protein